ncbi:hypothetical protein [Streptomyces sp. RK75]|uniref:hypothetical protein n=1 Tax=Streptomyces sp. RK75 TaxID=2824895 RepID=UPI001B36B10E|nr:hypothetical protein [Streptomyces sp. RK75]MBQ0866992.1 hypothetical protein [Streptomyces sp. RK75]
MTCAAQVAERLPALVAAARREAARSTQESELARIRAAARTARRRPEVVVLLASSFGLGPLGIATMLATTQQETGARLAAALGLVTDGDPGHTMLP